MYFKSTVCIRKYKTFKLKQHTCLVYLLGIIFCAKNCLKKMEEHGDKRSNI